LMKLGWIEREDIPAQQGEQTADLWAWVSKNLKSDFIEFVGDGHYSAGWDDKEREKLVKVILKRLKSANDIDLVIAMGTWAGKDLANEQHGVPTMVLSTSDPISSGIIKSVEDSGFDHVHARVDPGLHARQIKAFHEIIGFKKLGVAYEDSVAGRSYAAVDVAEEIGRKHGFKVVSCHTKSDISDISHAEQSVVDCFEWLSNKVDALYITEQGGVTPRSMPRLVAVANEHSIPTFSQQGSDDVKQGVLASLSKAEYRYIGEYHAKTFAQVFNGAKPNQLAQLFEEPPKMAINLKTAEIIGFNPPVVLLGAADEIFEDIASSTR
ncbi:MAG: ABC transporter substrate-binding protein, partial [Gammaproteobacteria bacterium]|nr:ABC transporter substrate-binding protein [Gammaproteobacteria bacterium]